MSEYESLKEKLFNNKKPGWENLTEDQKQKISAFADEYIYFLNKSKTEREVIEFAKDVLQKNGFADLREKTVLEPGDRVYFINRAKSMYIAVIRNRFNRNRIKYYRITCRFTTIRFKTKSII